MADLRVARPLTSDELTQLVRLVATETDKSMLASSDPHRRDVGEKMTQGIVDVVLNRRESGRWVDPTTGKGTIQAVGDAWKQFSDINSGISRYRSVTNPNIPITQPVNDYVRKYVAERMAGRPSSVGGAMNYANPHYSSANNLGWINGLEGPRHGIGKSVHYYGTAPGYKATEAVFNASEEYKKQFAADEAKTKFLHSMFEPGKEAERDNYLNNAKGVEAYGIMSGVQALGEKVLAEQSASPGTNSMERKSFAQYLREKGVDVEAYNRERGVLSKEERDKLTTEQLEKGIKDGKYVKSGDDIVEYERAQVGAESKKVVEAFKKDLENYKKEHDEEQAKAKSENRTPNDTKYSRTIKSFKKDVDDQAEQRRRQQLDGGGSGGPGGGLDPMTALILALLASAFGNNELAQQFLGMGGIGGGGGGVSRGGGGNSYSPSGHGTGSGEASGTPRNPGEYRRGREERAASRRQRGEGVPADAQQNWEQFKSDPANAGAVIHTSPVAGDALMTCNFGPRNLNIRGSSKYHRAHDLGWRGGNGEKTIVASAPGIVINVQHSNDGYGNMVQVKHADGSITQYGHLASISVKPGDKLGRAEKLGVMGETGVGSGVHLDYKQSDANGNWVVPSYAGYGQINRAGTMIDPEKSMAAFKEMEATRQAAGPTLGGVTPGQVARSDGEFGSKSYASQGELPAGYIPMNQLNRIEMPDSLRKHANSDGWVMTAVADKYGIRPGRGSAWTGRIVFHNFNTGQQITYQAGGGGSRYGGQGENTFGSSTPGMVSHPGAGVNGSDPEINASHRLTFMPGHRYGASILLHGTENNGRAGILVHSDEPLGTNISTNSMGCLHVPAGQMRSLFNDAQRFGIDRIMLLNPDVVQPGYQSKLVGARRAKEVSASPAPAPAAPAAPAPAKEDAPAAPQKHGSLDQPQKMASAGDMLQFLAERYKDEQKARNDNSDQGKKDNGRFSVASADIADLGEKLANVAKAAKEKDGEEKGGNPHKKTVTVTVSVG